MLGVGWLAVAVCTYSEDLGVALAEPAPASSDSTARIVGKRTGTHRMIAYRQHRAPLSG